MNDTIKKPIRFVNPFLGYFIPQITLDGMQWDGLKGIDMATKKKDLHLYLTPEDQRKFDLVKRIMVNLGMPSSVTPQAVIRFALHRTAQTTEKAA